METTLQQDEIERTKAQDIIASTGLFVGVDNVRIELGEDHTGDAAMWIVFNLRPDMKPDVTWVKAFSDYTTKLTLQLIHSGLRRFPYTRLETTA